MSYHRHRRRGGGEGGAWGPSLEVIRGKFENIRANLKMKTFFRDHTNSMRKKTENFSEDLFSEITLIL